jgi:hypothetical protein
VAKEVTAMPSHDEIRARILNLVWNASNQRLRPNILEKKIRDEYGVGVHEVRAILNELVEEEALVFTYRDPCSYVEAPASASRRAARPMKVLRDGEGEYWICDAGVDPAKDLGAQGCWRCGSVPFTRND